MSLSSLSPFTSSVVLCNKCHKKIIINIYYWKSFSTKPSIIFSAASVSNPSSPRMRKSYLRDFPATVAPVFYKSDPHLLLHFPSHQSCSPARPATHLGPASPNSSRTTSRSKAAADRPIFTSPRPFNLAPSQDQ